MHVLYNRFLYDRKKSKYELGTTHKVKSYKSQSQENKNKNKVRKFELEIKAKTKLAKLELDKKGLTFWKVRELT